MIKWKKLLRRAIGPTIGTKLDGFTKIYENKSWNKLKNHGQNIYSRNTILHKVEIKYLIMVFLCKWYARSTLIASSTITISMKYHLNNQTTLKLNCNSPQQTCRRYPECLYLTATSIIREYICATYLHEMCVQIYTTPQLIKDVIHNVSFNLILADIYVF